MHMYSFYDFFSVQKQKQPTLFQVTEFCEVTLLTEFPYFMYT